MLSVFFTFSALSLLSGSLASGDLTSTRDTSQQNFRATCYTISSAVSSASQVYFSPSPEYMSDNAHEWYSSSDASACSVEPGTAKDVGKILQILGKSRTPFGVKSGGHATNPGFSSTPGVQISLTRFNTFKVNTEAQTVELGPSLTWDDVYERLNSYGATVIGGRIPGVGVGGLTLGGGYSYLTNEYGLAIDNVASFELVLPNGTVTKVQEHDDDLWFALRGGGNNFGIVTKFTVKTHPMDQVWGGSISYGPDQLDAVKHAIVDFGSVMDQSATIIFSFVYSSGGIVSNLILFYNAPNPSSAMTPFLNIPSTQHDIQTRTYTDFVKGEAPRSTTPGRRGHYCGFPTTKYSLSFLDSMTDQVWQWGSKFSALDTKFLIVAEGEPFEDSMFSFGKASAYPPDRSHIFFPSVLVFSWSDPSLDDAITSAIRQSADSLRAAAAEDGQDVEHAAVYPNFALFDTPLADMYGQNVPRLQALARTFDPDNVMGLAGGFKF